MKINCIIIDDEPLAIRAIKNHIDEFSNINILKVFSNPLEALACLEQNSVDVVFLDVDNAKINGLEFLKSIHVSSFVIITTAHKKYAADSYDLNVLDYLVKPIPFERFLKSINKLTQQILLKQKTHLINQNKTYIFLKADKKLVKIKYDDICYIESLKDYIKVFTVQGHYVAHKSISSISKELPDSKFLRIHRSYIIALHKITSIEGNLIEINAKRVPIGRKYIMNTKKTILG